MLITKKIVFILGFTLLAASSAMAYPTGATMDGMLGDWGVTPSSSGSSSDWNPYPGIFSKVEDQTSNYLNPGSGGQSYDAEALYVYLDNTNLYLALVTGFPSNPSTNGLIHSAGDIAIDFGRNGTYDYAVEIGAHNPFTYTGYSGTPGGVYKNVGWEIPGFAVSSPSNMKKTPTPTLAGNASSFIYNKSYNNCGTLYDHWVVEMSVPKSVFGTDWKDNFNVHWTQTCGNDAIDTTVVPEPSSMALLGIGLAGILAGRIRKNRK